MARAALKEVVERQGGERRVSARAAAADDHALAVDQPSLRQEPGSVDAVVDVDDAPVALETVAIGAAEAGAAAVVHVEHRNAAAGPVVCRETERTRRGGGRAAMALDEQRRLFVRWTCIVGIVRRIEQAESRISTFCGKFHGLDRCEIGGDAGSGFVENVRRLLQCPVPAGIQVERDDAGSKRRRPGNEHDPIAFSLHRGVLRERRLQRLQCPRREIDRHQFAEPCLRARTDDAVRPGEGVGGHAERPLRLSELRRHGRNRARGARRKLVSVQVPPARPVGDEDDAGPVGRPLGLKDRFRRASCDLPAARR